MIKTENNILVSVCIATYNRQELLRLLLESLANQVIDKNIEIEIVITDNDPSGNAKEVIENFKDSFPYSIKYFIQSQKNISLTRNVCVENAEGTFICFIDDDESADKNWIQNLMNCIFRFNADAAFGYVEPVFESGIPDKFKNREFYFSPVAKTGDFARHYYTTNCIIKSELIKSECPPFDPNYGLTGGEDVHLFEKLANKGGKFISSKEAITYEFIPKSRGNYKYLFNRSLRGGQSYLRRKLEQRKDILFKTMSIVKILLKFLYSILLFCLFPFSSKISVLAVLIMGDTIGKSRAILIKFKEIH